VLFETVFKANGKIDEIERIERRSCAKKCEVLGKRDDCLRVAPNVDVIDRISDQGNDCFTRQQRWFSNDRFLVSADSIQESSFKSKSWQALFERDATRRCESAHPPARPMRAIPGMMQRALSIRRDERGPKMT
jgi:hypothetical protein